MLKRTALPLLMVLCTVLAGCQACRPAPPPAPPAKIYTVTGILVGLPEDRKDVVSVAHDEIPGYMKAMTMEFTLARPAMRDGLVLGSEVKMDLEVTESSSRVTQLIVTRQGDGHAAAAAFARLADGTPGEPIQPAKVGDEIADFTLYSVNEAKDMNFASLRGSYTVVAFIYISCPLPEACPMVVRNLSRFQEISAQEKPPVRIVAITIDPENDTPEALQAFGKLHGAKPERWDFWRGTEDTTGPVSWRFGVRYWPDGGNIGHDLITTVVDPDGKVVSAYYRPTDWTARNLLDDIRADRKKRK